MYSVFLSCGFEDVTGTVNLVTGAGLRHGDVLLNTTHHTAMYCGNGKEVEASINERGTAVGGAPGDQTGHEFLIRSYRNFPLNHVLRAKAQPQAVYYTVQRGDPLFAIARRYGTSVSAIQKLNASLIKNVNLIQVGWKIRVKLKEPVGT